MPHTPWNFKEKLDFWKVFWLGERKGRGFLMAKVSSLTVGIDMSTTAPTKRIPYFLEVSNVKLIVETWHSWEKMGEWV